MEFNKHIENLLADLKEANKRGELTESQKNLIMAACGEEQQKISVSTPFGNIVSYPSTDPMYPGIYVDFEMVNGYSRSVALTEYTPAPESGEAQVRLLCWNNSGNIDDDCCYGASYKIYNKKALNELKG